MNVVRVVAVPPPSFIGADEHRHAGAFDYRYERRGLHTWPREHQKMRRS